MTQLRNVSLIGAPTDVGAGARGASMGPEAMRVAGLAEALRARGVDVIDRGNLSGPANPWQPPVEGYRHLPEVVAWTEALAEASYRLGAEGMPIILGGDHGLAAGTLSGFSRRAAETGRPFFVLWLDAHPDFHTLDSTVSGNLHGCPVAYATGRPGFEGYFPPLAAPVNPENICMIGIRSVDPAERTALTAAGVTVHDMRAIDERLLRHILANLLGNAAKYSAPGAPIECTATGEGDLLALCIADHGIGIPAADLPRLFENFHRGANVGNIQGTGIGLHIVKECVDLHRGTIEVDSTLGQGTRFRVLLHAPPVRA